MLRSLQDWDIENKVFAITLDNAPVNDSFVKSLQDNLVAKGVLLSEGQLLHCRCAAHVWNLAVQEGFKVISAATKNIRESVKYVKSSQARKQRFEEIVERIGIACGKRPPLDVVTRWNSTYHMLLASLEYRRAFETLRRDDPQYTHEPSNDDWKMAKKLCDMLKPFYDATKPVSGSKYPTSSQYFHQFWEVKRKLEINITNPDLVIGRMAFEMKAKLKKYWDLSFLKICIPVILDPRFKLKFLEFRLNEGFGSEASDFLFAVETTFRQLFDEYSSESRDSILRNTHEVTTNDLNFDDSSPWADWGRHQSVQQRIRVSELEKYLEEDTLPVGVDLDILQFWKMHSTKYPIIARMARDILAVPASSVASESAFSTGERVINDYRSRLNTETIEALICLQDWLRSKASNRDNIAGNVAFD